PMTRWWAISPPIAISGPGSARSCRARAGRPRLSHRRSHSDVPTLSHHKASGQGVVRLNGRDVYCGRLGTAECQANSLRTIAEWLAGGRHLPRAADDNASAGPEDLTINEVLWAYLRHADNYYVKNGANRPIIVKVFPPGHRRASRLLDREVIVEIGGG